VICGYKHANFWRNRDDYGLKRRVTVKNIILRIIEKLIPYKKLRYGNIIIVAKTQAERRELIK